jgi:hypothetical protein
MAAAADFATTLHQVAQAIVTVLAVINPVVCGSIFLTLTPDLESRQKRWAAVHAALSILVILVASALIGRHVLGRFRHFIGCVQDRWRSHHRVYGIRYVGRRAEDRSSAAVLRGWHRCADLAHAAHHVCRWPGDDYRRGDIGGRPYAGWFAAVRTCGLDGRRRRNVRRLAACQSAGITCQPEHAGHRHAIYGAHCDGHGHAIRADRIQGVYAFVAGASKNIHSLGRRKRANAAGAITSGIKPFGAGHCRCEF